MLRVCKEWLFALAGCRRDRLALHKPGFWSSMTVFLPRKRPFSSLKTGFLNFSDKLLGMMIWVFDRQTFGFSYCRETTIGADED